MRQRNDEITAEDRPSCALVILDIKEKKDSPQALDMLHSCIFYDGFAV